MQGPGFDIDAARRLADTIAADLAALPADVSRHEQLKGEVAQLRAMLAQADAHAPSVEASLRSVHAKVERTSIELQSDGVRAGMILLDIGRMLGLD